MEIIKLNWRASDVDSLDSSPQNWAESCWFPVCSPSFLGWSSAGSCKMARQWQVWFVFKRQNMVNSSVNGSLMDDFTAHRGWSSGCRVPPTHGSYCDGYSNPMAAPGRVLRHSHVFTWVKQCHKPSRKIHHFLFGGMFTSPKWFMVLFYPHYPIMSFW